MNLSYHVASPDLHHSFLNGSTANETAESRLLHDSGVSFATPVDEANVRIRYILKDILGKFEEFSLLEDFIRLLEALHDGSVQPDSLPLILCFDLAKFRMLNNTTGMLYSQTTLQFWRLLYRLLGGGVIRALSGPKNVTQVVNQEASRGHYDPKKAKVNFAVPSEKILRNVTGDIPKLVQPGIINKTLDIVRIKANQGKEFILSYDAKMIGPGVSGERNGDVDLWGLEQPNLEKTLKQKQSELSVMRSLHQETITNVDTLIRKLIHAWKIASWRIRNMHAYITEEHRNKMRMQTSLINNPGCKKKYTYGISKVNANIYLTQQAIAEAMSFITTICQNICKAKQTEHCFQKELCIFGRQHNCYCLLPPPYISRFIDLQQHPEYVQQRTPEWLALRKMAPITASTAHTAFGLRGIKKQQAHYKNATTGVSTPLPDSQGKERMAHGAAFERNAIATLCGQILPAYFLPCFAFYETGAYFIPGCTRDKLFEISPDGIIKCSRGNQCPFQDQVHHASVAIEVKCPFPKKEEYLSQPHYMLPSHYVIQCLLQMKALKVDRLLYMCSTAQTTTVIMLNFDMHLYNICLSIAEDLYGSHSPPYPYKLHHRVPHLKAAIKEFSQKNARFILQVPTILAKKGNLLVGQAPHCRLLPSSATFSPLQVEQLKKLCNAAQQISTVGLQLVTRIHELLRKPASEIGMFMISDSDRMYDPDSGNTWPLAYLLKGHKMNAEDLRKLMNKCLQQLHAENIPVLCFCVDGQWSKLCFRDEEDKPLTRLGLQKDTWSLVKKKSKRGCLKLLHKGTAVSLADLDLLRIQKREGNNVHKFGNISVQYPLWDRGLHVTSNGGSVAQSGFIKHVKTAPKNSNLWRDPSLAHEGDNSQSKPEKTRPVGLQEGESNLLNATPDYVIESILQTRVADCHGFFCFAHLQTVLEHDDFPLLKDMLLELQQKDDNWHAYTEEDLFPTLLHNAYKLFTECTVDHLRVMGAVLRKFTKRSWIGTEMIKYEICNSIASAFGCDELIHGPKNKPRRRNPVKHFTTATLRELSEKVILQDNYPLIWLRVAIATGIHVTKVNEWEKSSPVPLKYTMPPTGKELTLFSKPLHSNGTTKATIITMDVTHMLTNLRTHVLQGNGFTFADKRSWRKIADSKPKIISRSIVYDNIDCQSAAFAKRVFSHAVEQEMIENGDLRDAGFVRHVRNWYAAADKRGVSCHKRMEVFHEMHALLTSNTDFNAFPPPGNYVHGIPSITYQAILQNIDSRVVIFGISDKGSINQRVISTLPNESAFADLVHMDKDGLGTPKSVNVPALIGKIALLNDFKHMPNK